MKNAKEVLTTLGVALLLCSKQVHAGSLRCGTALVGEGVQMAAVLDKCGQPPRQHSQGPAPRPYGYNGYWNSAKISIWVYGPDGGAYQYLRFVNDRLVEIEMRRKAPGASLFPWE